MSLGVDQNTVTKVLCDAVENDAANKGFISTLLDHGADVRSNDGALLRNAFAKCNEDVYGLLVGRLYNEPRLVGQLLPQTLENREKADSLLARGCRQGDLDSALQTQLDKNEVRDCRNATIRSVKSM